MVFDARVKTLEELGELAVIVAKKMMYPNTDEHPDGAGSMKRRMEDEVADVRATTEMLIRHEKLDRSYIEERRRKKIANFIKWANTDFEEYGNQGMKHYYNVQRSLHPTLQVHIDGTSTILEDRMRESVKNHMQQTCIHAWMPSAIIGDGMTCDKCGLREGDYSVGMRRVTFAPVQGADGYDVSIVDDPCIDELDVRREARRFRDAMIWNKRWAMIRYFLILTATFYGIYAAASLAIRFYPAFINVLLPAPHA